MRAAAAIALGITLLAGPALANGPLMNEGLSACFVGLPKFASVNGELKAAGWRSQEGADPGEYELGKGGANVFVSPGNQFADPGCTVMSADLSRKSAEALLEQQLNARFKGAWKTARGANGTGSWVVPLRGGSLVMHVNGGGNSGDDAGSGISLSVKAKR